MGDIESGIAAQFTLAVKMAWLTWFMQNEGSGLRTWTHDMTDRSNPVILGFEVSKD